MKPLSTATFTRTLGLRHRDTLDQDEAKKVRDQALEFVDSFTSRPDVDVKSDRNGHVFTRSGQATMDRLYVSKGWVSDKKFIFESDADIEFTTSRIKDGQPYRSKQFTLNVEAKSKVIATDFDRDGNFKKEVTLLPADATGRSLFLTRSPKPIPVKQFELPDFHFEALEAEIKRRDSARMYDSYLSQQHLLPHIPGPGPAGE